MKLKLGWKDPTPLLRPTCGAPSSLLPLHLCPGQAPAFPLPGSSRNREVLAAELGSPAPFAQPHPVTLEDKEGKPAWR